MSFDCRFTVVPVDVHTQSGGGVTSAFGMYGQGVCSDVDIGTVDRSYEWLGRRVAAGSGGEGG